MGFSVKDVYANIVNDGVDYVCSSLDNMLYGFSGDIQDDDDFVYMLRDCLDEYFDWLGKRVNIDKFVSSEEDGELVLRELGIDFGEMTRLNEIYGCTTLADCAKYAIMEWLEDSHMDIEDEIIKKVCSMREQGNIF